MIEAPWLSMEKRVLVNRLLLSHQKAFDQQLIKYQKVDDAHRLKSQELFVIALPVIAHDDNKDPKIIYVNASALKLWRRSWKEMVGMPSRLTAPNDERKSRAVDLKKALLTKAVNNYQGVRIDSKGRRFAITNARIWTIWDDNGLTIGQAATFTNWWWIK